MVLDVPHQHLRPHSVTVLYRHCVAIQGSNLLWQEHSTTDTKAQWDTRELHFPSDLVRLRLSTCLTTSSLQTNFVKHAE